MATVVRSTIYRKEAAEHVFNFVCCFKTYCIIHVWSTTFDINTECRLGHLSAFKGLNSLIGPLTALQSRDKFTLYFQVFAVQLSPVHFLTSRPWLPQHFYFEFVVTGSEKGHKSATTRLTFVIPSVWTVRCLGISRLFGMLRRNLKFWSRRSKQEINVSIKFND